MISAGRVLLIPRGDYDPTETYEMLDIVSYNGSSYIATRTTTGNLPTNTTYWQLSAYGGQASNLAGNFAPLETTDYATRPYQVDEIFVDKDSQLVVATDAINIGDEIEIGSNCEITTIADLLDAIKNHYDALDQRNRKLIGITQLTAQTDLHLLVPGEYYKKLTNFYVTNGPTGVNQVPTAVFRLTVESGLDESSSSILLTIRASDGKVYTQSYDGTSWSAWVEVSSKAYVDSEIASLGTASTKDSTNAVTEGSTDLVESGAVYTGLSAKANSADLGTAAYKDSTNAVTSGSTDPVESGAVYSELATRDAETSAMNNILGAKNLLPNNAVTQTAGGVTFIVNTDKSVTATGTAQSTSANIEIGTITLPVGRYILSGCPSGGSASTYFINVPGTQIVEYGDGLAIDVATPTTYTFKISVQNGYPANNLIFKPMVRPASIKDDTYAPYAMTNSAISNSLRLGDLSQFRTGRVDSLNADYVDFTKKDQSYNRVVFYENDNNMVFQHYDTSGNLLSQYNNMGVTGTALTVSGSPFPNVGYSRAGRVVSVATYYDITTNWTGWSGVALTGFPKPLLDDYSFSYALYNGVLYAMIYRIATDGNLYIFSELPVGVTIRTIIKATYITNDQ